MRAQGTPNVRRVQFLSFLKRATLTDFFHCGARFLCAHREPHAHIHYRNIFTHFLFLPFFRRLEYTRERLLEFKKELLTKQDGHGGESGGGFGGFGGFGGGGEVSKKTLK